MNVLPAPPLTRQLTQVTGLPSRLKAGEPT